MFQASMVRTLQKGERIICKKGWIPVNPKLAPRLPYSFQAIRKAFGDFVGRRAVSSPLPNPIEIVFAKAGCYSKTMLYGTPHDHGEFVDADGQY